MGLIDTIRKHVPLANNPKPEADISADDFDSVDDDAYDDMDGGQDDPTQGDDGQQDSDTQQDAGGGGDQSTDSDDTQQQGGGGMSDSDDEADADDDGTDSDTEGGAGTEQDDDQQGDDPQGDDTQNGQSGPQGDESESDPTSGGDSGDDTQPEDEGEPDADDSDGDQQGDGGQQDTDTQQEGDDGANADSDSDADSEGNEDGEGDDGTESASDDGDSNGDDGDAADDDDGMDGVPDKYEDDLRDMMEADEQDSTGRRADVDDKQDYQDGSEFGDRVSNRVRAAENAPTTDIDQRKADRDDRIGSQRVKVTAQEVRNEYKMQRLANDFEDAFRDFKFAEDEVERYDYGEYANIDGVIRRKCGDFTAPQYKETQPAELGDRLLVVVADASGSMDELQLKLSLLGLATAAEQIRDKIAIIAYSKNYDDYTQLVTAPHEEFRDEHLDSFRTGSRTPTPYGIRDARSLTNKITHREPVIIVVTDGKANEPIANSWDSSKESKRGVARRESAEQVTAATQEGCPVIGIGVGDDVNDQYMSEIFDDHVHTDMAGLADKLADVYEDQLRETNTQYATTY